MRNNYFKCEICKKQKKRSEMLLGETIRSSIAAMIKKKQPDWSIDKYICRTDFDVFRQEYIQHVLETEKGELSRLDKEVLKSLAKHEILSKNIEAEFTHKLSIGDKLADKVAAFGGSWRFIIFFLCIIAV